MNLAATHIAIGKRQYAVTDLANASVVYQQKRDDSGKGASAFPLGMVYRGERLLATVSYNGRVYAPGTVGKRPPIMEAQ